MISNVLDGLSPTQMHRTHYFNQIQWEPFSNCFPIPFEYNICLHPLLFGCPETTSYYNLYSLAYIHSFWWNIVFYSAFYKHELYFSARWSTPWFFTCLSDYLFHRNSRNNTKVLSWKSPEYSYCLHAFIFAHIFSPVSAIEHWLIPASSYRRQ